MLKILFVCGGNTCRSPMAQALAARLLGPNAIVESAGLDAETGLPANPKAKVVMEECGLNVDEHRAKDIEDVDLGAFDIIVALDPRIARRLTFESSVEEGRLRAVDIKDPFRGGLEEYRQCAQKLQAMLPAVLQ